MQILLSYRKKLMYLTRRTKCKIFFDNHNPFNIYTCYIITNMHKRHLQTKFKISKLISSVVFDKASSRRRMTLQIPVSDYCTLGKKHFGPLEVEYNLRSK